MCERKKEGTKECAPRELQPEKDRRSSSSSLFLSLHQDGSSIGDFYRPGAKESRRKKEKRADLWVGKGERESERKKTTAPLEFPPSPGSRRGKYTHREAQMPDW